MKRGRYEWVKCHQHDTIEYWREIVFSDESKLEAMTERPQYVRRCPSERFGEASLENGETPSASYRNCDVKISPHYGGSQATKGFKEMGGLISWSKKQWLCLSLSQDPVGVLQEAI
ncbi:hypothetical protein Trydic_g21728 [Trypoxylus dichotomus]